MLPNDSIKPKYDSACFSHLPGLVKDALRGEATSPLTPALFSEPQQKFDKVVFFLIDAFGWRFFEKYGDRYPFLQHFIKHGKVSKLTSQFPSTTSAHVTTLFTNQVVGQHGVFEWQYYEPKLDAMIVPLLYSFSGEEQPELLSGVDIDPREILPNSTFFETLQAQGVTPWIFQDNTYLRSTYSATMTRGARASGYKTLAEVLVNVRLRLKKTPAPAALFLYIDTLDATLHRYGPGAPQVEAEIDAIFTIMDRAFLQQVDGAFENTLFLLTADHGQMWVDPKKTLYLNQTPQFPQIRRLLRENRRGEVLAPGGSPRDMFLYVKEPLLGEAKALVAAAVQGRADVYSIDELIAEGLFGPEPPSPTFLSRVGNLVILPRKHETVWWYEKDRFEQKFYGHHGGLSPEEMEIPMLTYHFV
ncbi:MAG TPA: alkaline phosphatase family protein [Caldilineae bacterium]|nr:alkaline phosphatase family protein [Caldilineae bacterium]